MRILYDKLMITFILFLLISSFIFSPYSKAEPELKNGQKIHLPIEINSNQDFKKINGVVKGEGSKENPYFISNWTIKPIFKNGISISNTDAYVIIENCKIIGNKLFNPNGIFLNNVKNTIIKNSSCKKNYFGIIVSSSSNNTIENCILNDNENGLTINSCMRGDIPNTSNNTIKNCNFNNCKNGIYFCCIPKSKNNIIIDCVFKENDHGILFDHLSSYTKVINCNFTKNIFGIKVYSTSNNNHFSNNIFIKNTIHAFDNCKNYWDNGKKYGGNYWDDNTNEIYIIPGNGKNIDKFPLKEKQVNKQIIAMFSYIPSIPRIGKKIFFDASLSYYSTKIENYKWDFGNGVIKSGSKVSHIYSYEGVFNVTLNVSSDEKTDIFTRKLKVINVTDDIINIFNEMSLQDTINTAKPGTTIKIWEGIYKENIIIKTPYLNIIGNNSKNTIICGDKSDNVFFIKSSFVNISNLTITNSSKEGSGIQIGIPDYDTDIYGCNIKNNIIFNNFNAIKLNETTKNYIESNIISNNKFGISAHSSYYNNFKRNKVFENDVGFYIHYGSNWNEIVKNNLSKNDMGLFLNWSHDNNILNNNIKENELGIKLSNALSNNIHFNNLYDNDIGLLCFGKINNKKFQNNYWGSRFGPSYLFTFLGDKIIETNQKGRMKFIGIITNFLGCYQWEKEEIIFS